MNYMSKKEGIRVKNNVDGGKTGESASAASLSDSIGWFIIMLDVRAWKPG